MWRISLRFHREMVGDCGGILRQVQRECHKKPQRNAGMRKFCIGGFVPKVRPACSGPIPARNQRISSPRFYPPYLSYPSYQTYQTYLSYQNYPSYQTYLSYQTYHPYLSYQTYHPYLSYLKSVWELWSVWVTWDLWELWSVWVTWDLWGV